MNSKIMEKSLKEAQEEEEDRNNTNISFFLGMEEPPEKDDTIDDDFAGFSETESSKIMKKTLKEVQEEEEEKPPNVQDDFAGFSQTQSQFDGNESQQFMDSLVAKMKACFASITSVPKIDKSMIDMYKGGQMGSRVAAEVKEVDDQILANGDDKDNANKNHIEINNLSNNEGNEETTEAHKKQGSKIGWIWPVLQEHQILTVAGILGALAAIAVAYRFYRSG